MDYHQKYLKYKAKYLELQKQLEGSGIKTQLKELQTHFGQLQQERDEGFARQRRREEKKRLDEERRQREVERKKKEEEWKNQFMKSTVDDLKKSVKTLTDEQIIDLPFKGDYMPHPRSISDDWLYYLSYENYDEELRKIKKEAKERIYHKKEEERLGQQGDPNQ
jgi:hypothetical protein